MVERSSIYTSDNEQLLPLPKTGPLRDSLSQPETDHQKIKKAAVIIKKDLPADHLTAIYWG
jgi:hypothetical protein